MSAALHSLQGDFLPERDRFALAREAARLAFQDAIRPALAELLRFEVTAESIATYNRKHAAATGAYRRATFAEREASQADLERVPRTNQRVPQ